MNKSSSKLALGSANFGLNYGIANKSGKIFESELSKILMFAREACIEVIDTSKLYGDSEARIGSLVKILNSTLLLRLVPKLQMSLVIKA